MAYAHRQLPWGKNWLSLHPTLAGLAEWSPPFTLPPAGPALSRSVRALLGWEQEKHGLTWETSLSR